MKAYGSRRFAVIFGIIKEQGFVGVEMVTVDQIPEDVGIGFAHQFLKRCDDTVEIIIDALAVLPECLCNPVTIKNRICV